jgi:SAM-dependent methyltransferase
VPTAAVSAHGYDFEMQEFILKYSNGLVLDCGAGSKANYLPNVVNFEIVDYPSTDILGVGEMLPFKDNTFDGVISVAVLEHVRDPFKCAQEISRVLKPGGKLYCAMPFLQPYHGYPHHYFNATHQGVMRLFEEDLKIDDVRVVPSTHPMHALHWILSSWKDGLSGNAKKEFEMMTVADFLTDIHRLMQLSFCLDLSEDKLKELACGTILRASKVCT